MSIEVKIPAVGESITSGVLSAWHKQNGDMVNDGEALFTLETDKISTEVPAVGSGKLRIQVDAGQEVKIGQLVALLEDNIKAPGGEPSSPAEAADFASPAANATVPRSVETTPVPVDETGPATRRSGVEQERNEILSPAARRIAEEEKVELSEVMGTGKHGQVTKSDLIQYLESKSSPPAPAKPSAAPAPDVAVSTTPPTGPSPRFTRRKMSSLRKKIAAQLVLAQQNAAMLTTFNECDMSAVMQLRSQYQESFQKRHTVKLGFMSFFIKAVVAALQSVPEMNARIDGDDLVENHYYDIGVAVGTDRGLVVPVIRDADKKSFAELEKEVTAYAGKAREGKLHLDDLTGGVFTITNGGIYGSLLSTPILNPPQSGILGMHKIQNRPIAIGDKIEVRPMMYLAVSYDHRVVDGKEAVTFLIRVKEYVEAPIRFLLEG
ncbi:MAG TPA: 2-oxoglutarate dehydrogenase complex dihydrolipoyllysine-residue succinyltransferase [Chthoniobacterales bacterium]|jgi:2-oxoglutarate dehydrogenase E2 component (dihydrolipoamide succinyltransferase)|nr:2-oxoglutarate dehydrogenase complex dihydrolipoyllysine-residue succinyltransferase [Chthoniobacterales bacterium]